MTKLSTPFILAKQIPIMICTNYCPEHSGHCASSLVCNMAVLLCKSLEAHLRLGDHLQLAYYVAVLYNKYPTSLLSGCLDPAASLHLHTASL